MGIQNDLAIKQKRVILWGYNERDVKALAYKLLKSIEFAWSLIHISMLHNVTYIFLNYLAEI